MLKVEHTSQCGHVTTGSAQKGISEISASLLSTP